MARPIPVDIIPSHVYLSVEDQSVLFGSGHPMTVGGELSQPGQLYYEETVEVFGRLKRGLILRVLGPNWARSIVEVTPTEAAYLGISAKELKTGEEGVKCRLVGPAGEVVLDEGISVPKPHVLCSADEARAHHLQNGSEVAVMISGDRMQRIEEVVVRVHPMFRWRLEIHQDYARDLWLTRPTHARIQV